MAHELKDASPQLVFTAWYVKACLAAHVPTEGRTCPPASHLLAAEAQEIMRLGRAQYRAAVALCNGVRDRDGRWSEAGTARVEKRRERAKEAVQKLAEARGLGPVAQTSLDLRIDGEWVPR